MSVTYSEEQQCVIDAAVKCNVIVNAVAGSGKTTTIFGIIKSMPSSMFLVLTYNQRLKGEMRAKCDKERVNNAHIHNYHSFAVQYFGTKFNDLRPALTCKWKKPVPQCTHIIIDEAQDMEHDFFLLVKKIASAMTSMPLFVVMGDKRQSIFTYRGSDHRFLTMADRIFPSNDHPWISLSLSTSYRCTEDMAAFVNHCMKTPLLTGRKKHQDECTSDFDVELVTCNMFVHPARYIEHYIRSHNLKPQDVYVISHSVSNGPPKTCENALKSNNPYLPMLVATNSDDSSKDDSVYDHKLVFSTIHRTKGLERNVVFFLGFDASNYTYFAKGEDPERMTNELYVACTRAKQKLVLFRSDKEELLSFANPLQASIPRTSILNLSKPRHHDEDDGSDAGSGSALSSSSSSSSSLSLLHDKRGTTVTSITKFLKTDVIEEAMSFFSVRMLSEPQSLLQFPSVVKFGKITEDVSPIIATAINLCFFHRTFDLDQRCTMTQIREFVKTQNIDKVLVPLSTSSTTTSATGIATATTWEEWLCHANLKVSYVEEVLSKVFQVTRHDYVDEKELEQGVSRLHSVVEQWGLEKKGMTRIKRQYATDSSEMDPSIIQQLPGMLSGNAEIVTDDVLMEVKCVTTLTVEHQLQLALLALLTKCVKDANENMRYLLFNVKTNECLELFITLDKGLALFDYLWKAKHDNIRITDERFLQKALHSSTLTPVSTHSTSTTLSLMQLLRKQTSTTSTSKAQEQATLAVSDVNDDERFCIKRLFCVTETIKCDHK